MACYRMRIIYVPLGYRAPLLAMSMRVARKAKIDEMQLESAVQVAQSREHVNFCLRVVSPSPIWISTFLAKLLGGWPHCRIRYRVCMKRTYLITQLANWQMQQ